MADAYYDKVVLLLPMNGADGGTTFTDYAPVPKTVSVYGNTHTETDQSKFYGSSSAFDGADDYLTLLGSDDFYFSGDFTIETWVRFNTLPTIGTDSASLQMIYHQRLYDTNRIFIGCSYWSGGDSAPNFWLQIDNGSNVVSLRTAVSTPLAINTWYHLAVTVASGFARVFIDGLVKASGSITGSIPNLAATPIIGKGWSGIFDLNGYLQDFRITKGVARYTDTFTPPGKLCGTISGTIYDAAGDPAQRTVIAVPRTYPNSRAFTAQSSAVDGSYILSVPDVECSRIVLADETTLFNDIIDRVLPG